MAYKLKTLLVFDTNTLRVIEAGEVPYSTFIFGRAYRVIKEFIENNDLSNEITLVVPAMVIDELKQQKQRQYQKDIKQLKEIVKRLTGLPHIANPIEIPDETFNCADYIEQEASTYFVTNQVNVLKYKDEDASSMLKSMLTKVVGLDKPRSPFAKSGNTYNDAGFKDSFIWETLMHYEEIADFDKVIFLTKDGDYQSNCLTDFTNKWQKYIAIEKEENTVLSQLKRDYENYIDNRQVYEYAQKEYFSDYLNDQLKPLTYIQFDGEDLPIQNYNIREYCERVDVDEDIDGDFVRPIIISNVLIYTVRNSQKLQVPVLIKTTLSDYDTLDIEETVFDPIIF